MKFENVVQITQKSLAQAMGAEYMDQLGEISALDSAKLADVGREVTQPGTVEKFTNSLISLLGKFELLNNEYKKRLNSLYVDSFEWGGFIERTVLDLTKIIDDPMYNTVDGTDYSEIEHTFYGSRSVTKIFEEAKPIMSPISIQSEELREAFRSWDQLNMYLSGIRMQVRNTINFALNMYEHMIVSCGIAVSAASGGLNNARHLLTEAKAKGIVESDVTSEEALENADYLAYCCKQIYKTTKFMEEITTAFNDGTIPMFADEIGKILLTDFAASVKFDLLARTYNPNDLSIGDYDEVAFWQGTQETINSTVENFEYSTNSKIMLTADAATKLKIGSSAVTINNVIGIAFDKRAMGMCLRRSKVTSSYTACADFWNEFHHELLNYLLDSTFGMVAFIND